MAILGKVALLGTMRAPLGDPLFAGGAPTPAAISLRFRASPSAPFLRGRSHAHTATARSSVAVARFSGGNPVSTFAISLRFRASSSAPVLHRRSHARTAAARSSVVVARFSGGNPVLGGAGSGADGEEGLPAPDAADRGRGAVILGADEARRVASVVAFFLCLQKASFLREKLSDANRKFTMAAFIDICLWIGLMAYKGHTWAVMLVSTFEKGEKIHKIIAALATIFK